MELGTEFVVQRGVSSFVTGGHHLERKATITFDVDSLRNGLLSKIKPNHFALFILLLTHMDDKHMAYPSIETMAAELGCSKQKVQDGLKHLQSFTVEGKPLLSVKRVSGGTGWAKNIYQLNLPAVSTVVNGKTGYLSAQEILDYFSEVYLKAYGEEYMNKNSTALSQINTKLQGRFADEEMKATISLAVTKYAVKWGSTKYPTPTIGMLTSWLFQQAHDLLKTQQKEQQQFDDRVKAAEAVEQIDSLALLDL